MRQYLIAGNWKMHTDIISAVELVSAINKELRTKKGVDVLVCPPFTNIWHVTQELKSSDIYIGAQNCYFEEKGAFTGEISVEMIKALGCQYIIIGHSERRNIFKESDELINKKAHAILDKNMKPIICIGETFR
jgi:triosephosphate isomerase